MIAPRPYRAKRALDLVVVAAVAAPAIALGALAAAAIVVTSGRPVFFSQERVGHDGRVFRLLKFRTMATGPNPLVPDAGRVTRVGRWLRRFSVDELPQLLHVLTGEMSVVGPRPTVPEQVARYDERQRGRLAVRPGLTGWAQVNGRNSLSWDRRIALDLEYVARQGVGLDLRVLAATVSAVLGGGGVEGHPTDDPLLGDGSLRPGTTA